MKYATYAALILMGILVCAPPASADKLVGLRSAQGQYCHMEETASISFSLTGSETDVKNIKPLIEKKAEEIKTIAAELKISDVDMQNYSYNVYPGNEMKTGGCVNGRGNFQYSANFNFNVKPVDSAPDLASSLTAKGYNVSMNVNSYKQCQ